jgi:hypothetical protein
MTIEIFDHPKKIDHPKKVDHPKIFDRPKNLYYPKKNLVVTDKDVLIFLKLVTFENDD